MFSLFTWKIWCICIPLTTIFKTTGMQGLQSPILITDLSFLTQLCTLVYCCNCCSFLLFVALIFASQNSTSFLLRNLQCHRFSDIIKNPNLLHFSDTVSKFKLCIKTPYSLPTGSIQYWIKIQHKIWKYSCILFILYYHDK